MKKRILTVLLAVCMVFALGTVSALAEGEDTQLPAAVNNTITLTNDVVLSQPYNVEGNLTINLAGHSITASSNWSGGNYIIGVKRGATLTINDSSSGGSIKTGNNDKIYAAVIVTLTGEDNETNAANLIVNGGTLEGYYYGIAGNGTRHNTVITINGGNITGTNGAGIYHPQDGKLTIRGGNITGQDTAVEIRSGTLNISNGTFTSKANSYEEEENGSGTTVSGAAIAVSQHTTKKAISVTITGGTFIGPNAFSETKVQNQDSTENVTIDIDGGTFKGEIKSDDCTGFISGGFFFDEDGKPNTDINSNYFPTGSSVTIDAETGELVNNDTTTVATVDGVGYPSLQAAIDAAEEGDTVELTKDIHPVVPTGATAKSDAAITISKNLTIDGNGFEVIADDASFTTAADGIGNFHVFNITGGNVTIKSLDIDGDDSARSGINVWGNGTANPTVKIENTDIIDCTTYGVTIGSASVTADGLRTSGGKWGGVNVDTKNGDSSFTMESGTLADNYSVVVGESASHDSVVNLDGGTYNTVQVKVSNTDVNISRGTYGKIELTSGVNKGVVDVTGGTFKTSVSEYVDSSMPYEAKTSSGLYTYHRTPESAADAAGQGGDVNYIPSGVTHDVTLYYDKYVQTQIEVPHNYDFELPGGKYDGKEIIGWTRGSVTYKDGDEVEIDRDMTFYVVLKDGEFDITIDSKIEHGDISTNVNSADKGDTVYIYVDPDTGYVLDDIDVYYGLNYRYSVKVSYVRNNTYRFEMPNADVYITATFKANGMPFVDVHRTQWFYDSIYYVWSNDMMEGDSATTFNPDGTMTRAMFWAVLGRMDGQTITGTNWVEQARNWAMREGVSDGTNPNDYVTREQMVTMLWRYAGEKNGSANLNRYTDSGSVSGYAVEAMRWAIGNGVIQGVTSTTLAPKANATRAECATIFMRFDKM